MSLRLRSQRKRVLGVDTYYTVRIPYTLVGQTQWHPTSPRGPFSTLTRGAFRTRAEARAWAKKHLGRTTWGVVPMHEFRSRIRRDPSDEPRRGPFTPEEQTHRDELARAVKGTRKPTGSRIEKLRWIVREHQAARVDGAYVDAFTASAIVKVYDALNAENKAKYEKLPVKRMAQIAWKLVQTRRDPRRGRARR